jgi:NAD(P)-dependent dehydrogenase (short-subunit alcohol dehydrogenase family)
LRDPVEAAATDVYDRQTLDQPTDVTDGDTVADLFDRAVDESDGVDVLLNNTCVTPGAAMRLADDRRPSTRPSSIFGAR